MTSEYAPNVVNAGTAVSYHEGTTWRGKHEVSGKCCCKWGKKDIQKLSNHPTPQHSIPLQTVADEGKEKNEHCSEKEILEMTL
jgi:hypothetical protein